MGKFVGGVIGFFAGGWCALWIFAIILLAVCGSAPLSDMTTGNCLLVFFGPMVALAGAIVGAVLGVRSAEPSDAEVLRPRQGVTSSTDTPKPQLGQVKCPFCHSIAFRVVHEAGGLRCSDCHSVLPKYIMGNR